MQVFVTANDDEANDEANEAIEDDYNDANENDIKIWRCNSQELENREKNFFSFVKTKCQEFEKGSNVR